ncbi:MAG: hypothetical protein BRD50_01420 [Bacteroidetes bacterium SW_11_45_7]|nr:MAG: hypothetical protein BRD50_01420 [Bacteroidetes bacterium SW_11_45_7]
MSMLLGKRKARFIPLCFIVGTLLLVAGCKKDFQPEACFTTSNNQYTIYDNIEFDNCTSEGSTYKWDFGDGSTSTQINPVHKYDQPGEYRVSMKASSKNDEFQDFSYKVLEILEPVVGLWRVDYVEHTCDYRFNIGNTDDQGEWSYNQTSLDLADTTYQVETLNEEEMVLMRELPSDDQCPVGSEKQYFLTRQTN